jgi:hypothetical protein
MTKQEEKPSPFLEQQSRRMAAQEALKAQRLTEAPPVQAATSEAAPAFDPNKMIVEGYSPVTGQTTSRTVDVSRPAQQRIVKPLPLTLGEIKAGLIEAGNEIDAAREKFEADNASLDKFYAEATRL